MGLYSTFLGLENANAEYLIKGYQEQDAEEYYSRK